MELEAGVQDKENTSETELIKETLNFAIEFYKLFKFHNFDAFFFIMELFY